MKNKKCSVTGCRGKTNKNRTVFITAGYCGRIALYPCNVCGQLHDKCGGPIINKNGDKAIFKNCRVLVGENDVTEYADF